MTSEHANMQFIFIKSSKFAKVTAFDCNICLCIFFKLRINVIAGIRAAAHESFTLRGLQCHPVKLFYFRLGNCRKSLDEDLISFALRKMLFYHIGMRSTVVWIIFMIYRYKIPAIVLPGTFLLMEITIRYKVQISWLP